MFDGDIQLINLDGVILNHNRDNKLVGQETKDALYLKKIKAKVDSFSKKDKDYYKILERLRKDSSVYLTITIPNSVINKPIATVAKRVITIAVIGLLIMNSVNTVISFLAV